ncbi:hypothetical protein C4D60_Mb09t22820 [Musa balbisiana]|uniref:Uncharacterized protein n=1 Tax=Musa balbisiana TaxID=52838 RepID=A0A4V4H3F7_MUSBA|nr:hypothetical protein C4D60_Mb09t22820 [Musa balbisiana]
MLQALLHYLKRISLEEERGRKARHGHASMQPFAENAELINVYPPLLERIKGVRQALMGKQRTVKVSQHGLVHESMSGARDQWSEASGLITSVGWDVDVV